MLKSSLTPTEQKIYFFTKEAKHGVITLDVLRSLKLTGEGVLRVAVSSMCKKGWLLQLKRGLYAVQPFLSTGLDDPFYLATRIYDGYLSFSSALHLHKLIDEVPFTIFIATRNKSASKTIGQYEFKAIALHKRAMGIAWLNDYFISTIPKTIYDSFYLPDHSGGLPKVLKAVYLAKLNEDGWKEFMGYVGKFEKSGFCQRVGYMLSLLNKTGRHVPNWVLKRLRGRIGSLTRLGGMGKGTFIKEWNLIDNVGEKELLSWWY